jgi:hypothetical protein
VSRPAFPLQLLIGALKKGRARAIVQHFGGLMILRIL